LLTGVNELRWPALIVAASLACAADNTDHAAAIEAIHAQILQAHRERDAEAWTALEADTVTVASRGELTLTARAERLALRQGYLGATRFSVYRDLQPPIVHVARDASQAWLFANVEVVAHPDDAGATDSTHVVWAWIELYERRAGKWLMVGNVSNERPGSVVAAAPEKTSPVSNLAWLAGCWEGNAGGAAYYEQWMRPVGGTMLGMSRTVANDQTVAYEFLRIHEKDGDIYYTANPSGQAQASFKLVKYGDREAVFENPEHDFPQRIVYRLEESGALVATTQGMGEGARTFDFPMHSAQCD
jgi:hypothetical protein